MHIQQKYDLPKKRKYKKFQEKLEFICKLKLDNIFLKDTVTLISYTNVKQPTS